MVVTHNDILKDFDKRLKLFHFKSNATVPEKWQGTDIVQRVHGKEIERKYKCTEERLITRLQLWVDACRINKTNENDRIEQNGKPKHNSEKRNGTIRAKNTYAKTEQIKRKKENMLTPTKLPAFIADLNKSNKGIHDDSHVRSDKKHRLKSMSLSFSTDNLHGYCSDGSDSTVNSESGTPQKTSKTLKQRFKFLTFRMKTPIQKNNSPKISSLPRERTRRSAKSLNDKSDRCDSIEKLDIIPTGRVRPSIFSMETLKDNIPQFSSNYEIEKRYCQTEHVRRKRILEDRRQTFRSEINSIKSRRSLDYEGKFRLDNERTTGKRYFYDPGVKKTDIGYV